MKLEKHIKSIHETTKWFKGAMVARLMEQQNLDKEHWLDCADEFLIESTIEKISLFEEIDEERADLKVRALVDAANFLMMIADKCRRDLS